MFDFGGNLRELRKKQGLTQEQVAELLEVSHITIGRWEGNRMIPSTKYIIQFSQLYDVPIHSLLGMEQKGIIFIGGFTEEQQNTIRALFREFQKENTMKGVSAYANEKNRRL